MDEGPKDLKSMSVHELLLEAARLLQESKVSIDKLDKDVTALKKMFSKQLPFTRKLALVKPKKGTPHKRK